MDKWIDGMMDYMKWRNVNRGYMKLEVWQRAVELYQLVWKMLIESKTDFKLWAQAADAAQSVSSNVAEGYSRRSINEYMQHLIKRLESKKAEGTWIDRPSEESLEYEV